MKKVLIIANSTTYHQAPRGIQASRILSYLAKRFEVYLITSNKSIPDRQVYFDNAINHINIISQSSTFYFRLQQMLFGFMGSFDFFFMLKSFYRSKKIIRNNNIEHVVTHSVKISNAFTGSFLKLKFGKSIKLIAFYSDPFSFNNYIPMNNFHQRIVLKLERFLFKYQDIIVFPSKIMVERYQELYPEYYLKFKHIPHSYLKVKNKNIERGCKKLSVNEKITIRYIGSLNEIRNPKFILDYLDKNISYFSDRIKFEFVGPKSKLIIDDFSKRGNIHSIVTFKSKVSVSEAQKLAASTDILLLLDANIDRSPYLPSKLVDYLSYCIPIIGVSKKNGESYRVLNETGHFPIDFDELHNLKDIIEWILLKRNELKFKIDRYSIDQVGNSWKDIID